MSLLKWRNRSKKNKKKLINQKYWARKKMLFLTRCPTKNPLMILKKRIKSTNNSKTLSLKKKWETKASMRRKKILMN